MNEILIVEMSYFLMRIFKDVNEKLLFFFVVFFFYLNSINKLGSDL